MKALVDNDVLLKGARYGLLAELLSVIPVELESIGILGSAKYVVRDRLRRRTSSDRVGDFEIIVEALKAIEPTESEIQLAAELEYKAMAADCELDEGESILCAVLVARLAEWLATGDRRAIKAIQMILNIDGMDSKLAVIQGRVICLEQLFIKLIESYSPEMIRKIVCENPAVDRALHICFSGDRIREKPLECKEGLLSYIGYTRQMAPTVLCAV